MQPQSQLLVKKLETLTPEHFEAVIDFVDFLLVREQQRTHSNECTRLSEPSLARVWDNEEDAAYDQL